MTPDGEVQTYKTKSGYSGENIGEYRQPGSNGLTTDEQGRLTICQHGNRRVVRIEKNGLTTVLADRFNGKRLNSPNDLVFRSDGTLFFTIRRSDCQSPARTRAATSRTPVFIR